MTEVEDRPAGPWGPHEPLAAPEVRADRDPAERPGSPWTWQVVLLIAGLAAAYAASLFLPGARLGVLSLDAVRGGRAYTLLTHMALHGGLAHLAFNLIALGQLGRVVGPLFGRSLRGGLVFLGFFLVCGLAGGLAFIALNPTGSAVGASGAICGLWGAAARLSGPGTLRYAVSGPEARSFVVMNIVLVVLGLILTGLRSAGVAWEAHLGGYVAGVLLIHPALGLALGATRRRP